MGLIHSLALWALVATPSGPRSADDVLRCADAILAPDNYEADIVMTLSRKGSEPRRFDMHVWKKDVDKVRVRFTSPPDERGSEVLRDGDSMWQYVPNLKRALRISAKQEFHGGDFSNTDILRVNLQADYVASFAPAAAPDEWVLELRGKDGHVSYDRVRYRVRRADCMPLAQEFYARSGKLLRTLELVEPKRFGRLVRPSRLVMKNAIQPDRSTEMVFEKFVVRPDLDGALFSQSALGR